MSFLFTYKMATDKRYLPSSVACRIAFRILWSCFHATSGALGELSGRSVPSSRASLFRLLTESSVSMLGRVGGAERGEKWTKRRENGFLLVACCYCCSSDGGGGRRASAEGRRA